MWSSLFQVWNHCKLVQVIGFRHWHRVTILSSQQFCFVPWLTKLIHFFESCLLFSNDQADQIKISGMKPDSARHCSPGL